MEDFLFKLQTEVQTNVCWVDMRQAGEADPRRAGARIVLLNLVPSQYGCLSWREGSDHLQAEKRGQLVHGLHTVWFGE